ncbi:urea transporter [Embleya sp. AB8]|uniref:urea transporter n=1 Tax=Embleya sp. AB8 TaxID=3156304 RepID=UPI003C712566
MTALRTLLRGIAQVDLVGNPWTGLVFAVALFVGDWRVGTYGLIGTVAATGTALLLGVERGAVERGLQGYSGCLTGIAVVVLLGATPASVLVAVLGAATSTVLTAALGHALRGLGVPVLTAPFCIVAELLTLASAGFRHLRTPGAEPAAAVSSPGATGHLSVLDAGRAFGASFAQVFLLDQWYVGLLMLLGLLIAGRTVAGAAAGAGAVAVLAAWALGAPTDQITAGLYGYNAVLVGIALGATFLVLGPAGAGCTLLGVLLSVVLTGTLKQALTPLHGSVYTWPFVLTTWLFLAATPALPRLRRRAPEPAEELDARRTPTPRTPSPARSDSVAPKGDRP